MTTYLVAASAKYSPEWLCIQWEEIEANNKTEAKAKYRKQLQHDMVFSRQDGAVTIYVKSY